MINPVAAVRNSWLSIWPVIQRELRAGSHVSFNYWIRVIAGAVSMIVLFAGMGYIDTVPTWMLAGGQGIILFKIFDTTLLVLIFIFVPAITADCLARERREGTLGLLFLTPLTAGGVVIGKSIAQGLRAWCLWLAVVPALTVPLLLGGVGWDTILNSLAIQFSAIVFALASGLLASCLTQQFFTAIVFAEMLTLIASYLAVELLGMILPGASPAAAGQFGWRTYYISRPSIGLVPSSWAPLGTAAFAAAALCYLAVVLIGASRWVKHSWRDKPPSLRQLWWIRTFCTDLFRDRFKLKLKRILDQNPIAWLQQYSWKARIGKWILCLLVVLGQSLALQSVASRNTYGGIMVETMESQLWMAAILGVFYTYAGVGSFIAEKKIRRAGADSHYANSSE